MPCAHQTQEQHPVIRLPLSPGTMPAYKLYYFPARGGAEMIRYVFAQAGVEYEDVRVPWGEEWNKLKPS